MMRVQIMIGVLLVVFPHGSMGVDKFNPSASPERPSGVPVWTNNRLTPHQPFPAKVKAIGKSWVGYTLLLEEITKDQPARSCIATIGSQQIAYRVLPTSEAVKIIKHPHHHATIFKTSVAVDQFHWDGLYKIGRKYEKKDSLRKWYVSLQEAN